MITQVFRLYACVAIASGAFLVTSSNDARAQEQQATSANVIEEIIVTARRREESLMSTPTSITAFTTDELQARQIDQIDQIAKATPGLVFQRQAGHNNHTSRIFIRGIGQDDYVPTKQVGVGLYVDGVYVAQNAGSLIEVVDVESIEVLRGPQGTLFGRNTIGGAIQVNTIKPREEFEADVELLAGSYDRWRVKGRVNIPFSDTFYGRFAALVQEKDGFIKTPLSPSSDEGKGGDNIDAGRVALRWTPNDSLTIDFAGDYSKQQSHGAPQVLGTTINNAFVGRGPRITNAAQYNWAVAPALGAGQFDNSYFLGDETHTSLTGEENNVESEVLGVHLTVQWDISDNMLFKSITSYRDIDIDANGDFDHTPLSVFHGSDNHEGEAYSQELQLSGSAFDERMHWVTGLYYYAEEILNLNTVLFPTFHLVSGSNVDNKSTAVFGQFTYDLSEKWSLTLGGRYTDEDLDSIANDDHSYITAWFCPWQPSPPPAGIHNLFVCQQQGPGFAGYAPVAVPPANTPFPGSFRILPNNETFTSDENQFEPYVNLAYNFTDQLMGYVSYAEGFKGGGFTQRIPPGRTVESFAPEFANVYEIGAKWSGEKIRLTSALFYTDYEDLQVLTTRLLGGTTENAADAEIKGGELELLVAITDRFRISLGLSYVDGQYNDVDEFVSFDENNDLPFLTEWQHNASASYVLPLSTGDLVARVDYSYTDEYYSEAENLPEHLYGDYSLWNASLTYTHRSEKWQVALAGRNLADEYYKVSGSQSFSRTGWAQQVVGPPREWSLRFSYSF